MSKPVLNIIKVGGNVIDNELHLELFLNDFSQIEGPKILVHGGGVLLNEMSKSLNLPQTMINGRRVTDEETLKLATMVYAGFVNKKIVANLNAKGTVAIGMSGADGQSIMTQKRSDKPIDFGFVGDLTSDSIHVNFINQLISSGLTPVFCAITQDKNGQLLNTNADGIAKALAVAFVEIYSVNLIYCFDKKGVLLDVDDDNSVIPELTFEVYNNLKSQNKIHGGMHPKLDNCFDALNQGVDKIYILQSESVKKLLTSNINDGTLIRN
jgi:acetylglutamate kinase